MRVYDPLMKYDTPYGVIFANGVKRKDYELAWVEKVKWRGFTLWTLKRREGDVGTTIPPLSGSPWRTDRPLDADLVTALVTEQSPNSAPCGPGP